MAATKNAALSCLCGAVRESGTLLSGDTFPLETDLCHCNDCRYSSGAFFSTTGDLREAPSAASLANCVPYASSKRLTRYFCKVCGSQCFLQTREQKRWIAFSGIITPQGPASDVVKVVWQGYVADTLDHKVPCRLYEPEVACYHQGNRESPMSKGQLLHPEPILPREQSSLGARCHCGAVSFRVLPTRGWDDASGVDPDVVPPAEHSKKFAANFCGCRSCRLALGAASLQPWMYVQPDRTVTDDLRAACIGEHHRVGENAVPLTGLIHYRSSPKVVRSFCGTCGATAFYCDTDMPEVLNIAMGLLRADEGSAADSWVWWRWNHVFGADQHVDSKIVAGLIEGGLR